MSYQRIRGQVTFLINSLICPLRKHGAKTGEELK